MVKKKSMEGLLDSFESDTTKEHDSAVAAATGVTAVPETTRATALVSMSKAEKERLTSKAKAHGLSLSAFFRLAADEYIARHDW